MRAAPNCEWSWLDSAQADFAACVHGTYPGQSGASLGCAALSGHIAGFLVEHPEASNEQVIEWLRDNARYRGPERRSRPMSTIVMLGAGPAGAAVALGLAPAGLSGDAGQRVAPVCRAGRCFRAGAGGLARRRPASGVGGCDAAFAAPGERGTASSMRKTSNFCSTARAFDRGLREDLRVAGVELIEGRVLGVSVVGFRASDRDRRA